jgi:8-oxo-dGTP pyrophosphatase MutT (NUDIX family)
MWPSDRSDPLEDCADGKVHIPVRVRAGQPMQENLRARAIAGTAIFRGDRILLLHRSLHASNPGIWDLPGGQVETRESLPRAARRETREETGLDVRIGPVFHAEVFSSLSKRGKMRKNVGVYFHCQPPTRKSPEIDGTEHSEYAWVSLEDLNSYPTVPFLDRTIRIAFQTRGSSPRPRVVAGGVRFSDRSDATLPVPA